MSETKTPNLVSPMIFLGTVAMSAFLTYLLVRGFIGEGVFEPGFHSKLMLILVGVLVTAVCGTIAFVGYQLLKISRDE